MKKANCENMMLVHGKYNPYMKTIHIITFRTKLN